jgi:hypothetical protein
VGEVINLRQYRKAKARAEAEAKAGTNRVQFGRKKSEREQQATLDGLIQRRLDGARIRSSEDEPKP